MTTPSLFERCRLPIENLSRDLRYSVRLWRRNPGFVAAVLAIMALGIGANTAIFSLINDMLFKVLPVQAPARLAVLARTDASGGGGSFSYHGFEQLQAHNQVFDGAFAFAYPYASQTSWNGRREEAEVQFVSSDYFATLGIRASKGDTAFPRKSQGANGGGPASVAVISHDYWKRGFESDPNIIGKTLTVDDAALTVIGVAPVGFSGVGLEYSVDLWVPIELQPVLQSSEPHLESDTHRWVMIMGRLKPRVSTRQAEANLNLSYQQYLHSIGASESDLRQGVTVEAGGIPVFGSRKSFLSPLLILAVLVTLILLISCVNVASLLLARASARQNEITIKLAVGAGRARLIRQLLSESILLALMGGAIGMLVAYLGSNSLVLFALKALGGHSAPPLLCFSLDLRTVAFAITISIIAGILFGLAPALRFSGISPSPVLKPGGASPGRGMRRQGLEKSFIVFQLSTSLLLLIMTGLLARSFQKMWEADFGFEPKEVVEVWLNLSAKDSVQQRATVLDQIVEDIQIAPGQKLVSMSLPGPFSHSTYNCEFTYSGEGSNSAVRASSVTVVTPEFFKTMQIPLLGGRQFSEGDSAQAPKVALINQTVANRYFPNVQPVGKHLTKICGEPGDFEIVGIVKDTKSSNALQDSPPMLYYLLPQSEKLAAIPVRILEVRGNPQLLGTRNVRRIIESHNRDVSIKYAEQLTDLIDQSLFIPRLIAKISGLFGILGLGLAGVGLYGIISYSIRQRTSEIGVRMALGAGRANILWMVLGEAMKLVGGGVVIGLLMALVVTRIVSSQLFGLSRFDPQTILGATLLLVFVAGVAAHLPARRASRVDPVIALRYE